MARVGGRLARRLATAAAHSGTAPLSIPVSAEETRSSANGNMLSGNAIHSTPRTTPFQRSEDPRRRRAAGTSDSVAKPMAMRTKVTPFGPTERRLSAMKRYEAPQMRPGRISSAQSPAPLRAAGTGGSVEAVEPAGADGWGGATIDVMGSTMSPRGGSAQANVFHHRDACATMRVPSQ